jgi:hypothetical protein
MPGACHQPQLWLPRSHACVPFDIGAVKKKESKLYGAHFKDVDHSQKATKISFDSDDE